MFIFRLVIIVILKLLIKCFITCSNTQFQILDGQIHFPLKFVILWAISFKISNWQTNLDIICSHGLTDGSFWSNFVFKCCCIWPENVVVWNVHSFLRVTFACEFKMGMSCWRSLVFALFFFQIILCWDHTSLIDMGETQLCDIFLS